MVFRDPLRFHKGSLGGGTVTPSAIFWKEAEEERRISDGEGLIGYRFSVTCST